VITDVLNGQLQSLVAATGLNSSIYAIIHVSRKEMWNSMETLIDSFDTPLCVIDFCPVAQDKLTFDSPLYKQVLLRTLSSYKRARRIREFK